jgi:hypothetical protein
LTQTFTFTTNKQINKVFGELVLGALYGECPVAAPIYLLRLRDESDADFLAAQKYRRGPGNDDEIRSEIRYDFVDLIVQHNNIINNRRSVRIGGRLQAATDRLYHAVRRDTARWRWRKVCLLVCIICFIILSLSLSFWSRLYLSRCRRTVAGRKRHAPPTVGSHLDWHALVAPVKPSSSPTSSSGNAPSSSLSGVQIGLGAHKHRLFVFVFNSFNSYLSAPPCAQRDGVVVAGAHVQHASASHLARRARRLPAYRR